MRVENLIQYDRFPADENTLPGHSTAVSTCIRLTVASISYSICLIDPGKPVTIPLANTKSLSRQMSEYILNPAAHVEKIEHPDPEITVYVVDDFLQNPEQLVEYARTRAYFGSVGDDNTAYPGIRDRLPRPYERVLEKIIELIYGAAGNVSIHRSMLSLTTLDPGKLGDRQKIPHADAFGDDQYAAVHYLCGPPHGGTAIYRYLPRNLVRIRNDDRAVVKEMLQQVQENPEQHAGYLVADTPFYKQEVVIDARFNRLVLYPSNLLHCAILSSPHSLHQDLTTGRLTVASFFRMDPPQHPHGDVLHDASVAV